MHRYVCFFNIFMVAYFESCQPCTNITNVYDWPLSVCGNQVVNVFLSLTTIMWAKVKLIKTNLINNTTTLHFDVQYTIC